MMVSFMLSFFPRGVLDEILNLIESVSEGFPSYSYITERKPSEKNSADKAEELSKFITKNNHVVIMEQGCDQHGQPGDGWAPMGGILQGISPMIPLDRIGRRRLG